MSKKDLLVSTFVAFVDEILTFFQNYLLHFFNQKMKEEFFTCEIAFFFKKCRLESILKNPDMLKKPKAAISIDFSMFSNKTALKTDNFVSPQCRNRRLQTS